MKKLLLILLVFFCFPLCAKDVETDMVLLQALDKTTGRTSFLTVKIEEPYVYGDLMIVAKKCLRKPPEETPENAAFLTITTENKEEEVFRGWMFSSDPALSAMEHPVYDIWVLECKEKITENSNTFIASVDLDETDAIDVDSLED